MRGHDRHLTDQEILQALDSELSPRRRLRVEHHLARCGECQARGRQIGSTVRDWTAVYQRSHTPAGAPDYTRERLRAEMRAAAVDGIAGQGARFMVKWRWAAIAAAVVLSIAVLRLPSSTPIAPRLAINVAVPVLPDASLTPGATWDLSLGELCGGGTREQRQVPAIVRQQVLREYRMEGVSPDEYELDYLIVPELGGAPDPRNLWPQRYLSGVWNAHVKDQLERLLPQLVCDRTLALATAQRDMAVDWIAAYKKYFKSEEPVRTQASAEDDSGAGITYPIWREGGAPALRLISFSPRAGTNNLGALR